NFDVNTKILNQNLSNKQKINIATIGSYSSKYKSIDTGIKTMNLLKKKGYNAHLYILGSGNKNYYIKLIKELDVIENIYVVWLIEGGKEVLKWLDDFDFYIHPRLTEGLPRALIEAMSRGLPAGATNVGGIPELIEKAMQFNKKD